MSLPRRRVPDPARAIATALTDAVPAARDRDLAAYQEAVQRFAAVDPEQVGLVLGAVVRSLLEDLHPDGLAGDDVRTALEHCLRSAAGWFADVDADVLVVLLAGALGVHQPDNEPHPVGGVDVAAHAPLLIADLLAASGRPLAGYLDAAFAEIARAETVEMP
jgi:hypothetical protein